MEFLICFVDVIFADCCVVIYNDNYDANGDITDNSDDDDDYYY